MRHRHLSAILADMKREEIYQPLDPREWDFRGLNPNHLYAAWQYELARESRYLNDALALLTPTRRKEILALSRDDWGEELQLDGVECKQFYRCYDVFFAYWCCPRFPTAWMALRERERGVAVGKYGNPPPPLCVLTRQELTSIENSEQWLMAMNVQVDDASNPYRRYTIRVDWSHDDPILKPLLLELLNLRPEGVKPRKHHTGKRASSPTYKFKQLAGWRLAIKGGLNYKAARQLLDRRQKDFPKNDPSDLLPIYASAGAWKDAVDAGQKYVRRGC